MPSDEQWFRGLLDADGVVREGEDIGLAEEACFRVFSQDATPKIRSAKWADFARRFCDTEIGITTDKRYGLRVVERDAARVVIAREGLRQTRVVLARSTTARDQVDAERAELSAKTNGLAGLARRCKTIFVVETEGENDSAALLLSAILAGTELGPVVYPGARDIVGFKTGWSRFQAAPTELPYR